MPRYDPEALWPAILTSIAGGRSLFSIFRQDGLPSYSWAKNQLRQNAALRSAYSQAQEDRADTLAEELIELADQAMPAGLDGPAASAWVQQLRLKVDVRKWAASKLRPRVYGERIDVAVRGEGISILRALADANRRVLTIDAE